MPSLDYKVSGFQRIRPKIGDCSDRSGDGDKKQNQEPFLVGEAPSLGNGNRGGLF